MTIGKQSMCFVAVLVSIALIVPKIQAATRTFQASSGNWSLAGNWQDGAKPVDGDDVVIAANSTCYYDVADDDPSGEPKVNTVTVSNSASLVINDDRSLEIGDDIGGLQSTPTGNLILPADGSRINIRLNHTIGGTGKIIGQHDSAEIFLFNTDVAFTLASGATIEGMLSLKSSSAADLAKFVNKGTVNVNVSGSIYVNTRLIGDESTGLWKVAHASGMLRLDAKAESGSNPPPTSLVGDFTVSAGTLKVHRPGIETTGTLTWTAGKIDTATDTVGSGGSAKFTGN